MSVSSPELVVFLHGYGADGSQAALLGASVTALLPGLRLAAPDAPDRCETGFGRQWFTLQGFDTTNRDAMFHHARQAFDRILERTIAEHGLAASLDRVVLAGFSQGGVMALDALATGRWKVGAVISFSSRMVTPEPLDPWMGSRALLLHGSTDTVIVPAYTIEAANRLAACGLPTEHHVLPAVGHTIVPEMLMIASRFLLR